MYDFLRKASVLLMAACMAVSPAIALAGTAETDFNAATGTGTVSFAGKPGREQTVSLSIYYPEAASHSEDTICWAAQEVTSAEGTVSFAYAVEADSPSGWYTGIAKSNLEKSPAEFTFYYSSNAAEIIAAFKALTADTAAGFIEQYTVTTPVFKSDYEPNPGKDALAPYFYALKEESAVEDITGINTLYNLSLAMYNLNTAVDYKTVDKFLSEDNEIFNLDINDDYERLKQEICTAILAELNSENGLKSYDRLVSVYNNVLVLTAINSASAAGSTAALDSAIVKYAEAIGIDADEYAEFDSDAFNRGLIGTVYESIEKFKEAYDARLEAMDGEDTGSDDATTPSKPKRTGGGGVSMPASPVVNTAAGFGDIAHVQWAKEAIDYLASNGIVNGYSDRIFAPDDNVTREQFIKMLVEAFELKAATASCEFDDVDKSQWYYTYIASAYDSKIVTGISDTEFGIGTPISRQDMAVMAYRCAKACGMSLGMGELAFDDKSDIYPYAEDAAGALSMAGIINGFEDGTFRPQGLCTRAQAAKVIYELLQKM
ncbi:MAG: S-layer homology domain-containing protein [Clostridia bacterium]|nr:S-layer homology domain-containing protein [Clostridia bacterium]